MVRHFVIFYYKTSFMNKFVIFFEITDSDVMLALDSRQFDHVAKDFLQKEKRKL